MVQKGGASYSPAILMAPPFWTIVERTEEKKNVTQKVYSEKESDQRRTHVLLYTNFWYWIIIFYTNVAFLLQFAQGREREQKSNKSTNT